MKIIFLDVDGVLNSNKFYSKRGEPDYRFDDEPPYPLCEFDPDAVELFNKITDQTGAKIVVSSTWRIGKTVDELKELFQSPIQRLCPTVVRHNGRATNRIQMG